jgi:hypothetical protein
MQIQNEEATRIIRDQAKLTLSEGFPQVLLPNVVPVMDMTPRFHKFANVLGSAGQIVTGSLSAFTSHATYETYVTGLCANYSKDATCDIATGSISVIAVIDGVSKQLARFSVVTLTAERENINITFRPAIKIDKNAAVLINGTYSLGLMSRNLTVYGYTSNSM